MIKPVLGEIYSQPVSKRYLLSVLTSSGNVWMIDTPSDNYNLISNRITFKSLSPINERQPDMTQIGIIDADGLELKLLSEKEGRHYVCPGMIRDNAVQVILPVGFDTLYKLARKQNKETRIINP